MKISQLCMVELRFECFEYYPYIQMWQYMLICGVGAKPVTHLKQYHLLQWEVAKVKPLMNSRVMECKEPIKLFISPRNRRKVLPGIVEKLVSSNPCRGLECKSKTLNEF